MVYQPEGQSDALPELPRTRRGHRADGAPPGVVRGGGGDLVGVGLWPSYTHGPCPCPRRFVERFRRRNGYSRKFVELFLARVWV